MSHYLCTLILPAALGKGDWLYCIGWKIFFVVPHDVPLQTWLPSSRHPWYSNPSFLVPQPLLLLLQPPPGAPTSHPRYSNPHPWYSNPRTRQCRRARCLEDPASPLSKVPPPLVALEHGIYGLGWGTRAYVSKHYYHIYSIYVNFRNFC